MGEEKRNDWDKGFNAISKACVESKLPIHMLLGILEILQWDMINQMREQGEHRLVQEGMPYVG